MDVDTDQASVRGQAKFIWRSTGKSWQDGMGENDHLLTGMWAQNRQNWMELNMTMLWSLQDLSPPLAVLDQHNSPPE